MANDYRRWESLLVSTNLVPPSKRSKTAIKMRAREKLHAALCSTTGKSELYPRIRWPKPRAAVALDIALYGDLKKAPRVDTICKWLLDELTGYVYRDDRQVKLLFAHADRRDPRAETANKPIGAQRGKPSTPIEDPRGVDWGAPVLDPASWGKLHTPPAPSPTLHVRARSRSNVLATLRAASQLPYEWDPIDDDDDYRYSNPYLRTYADSRSDLVEYRKWLEAGNNPDPEEIIRAKRELDYHDQAMQQRVVDIVFSSLFTFLPVQQFLGWNMMRDRLDTSPYVFNLGVLPDIGGSSTFKANLRQLLAQRQAMFPDLFPMRAKSGISMVLFEDDAHSKDLDNLIRVVLPDVLNVLRPPRTDLPGWVATAPDIESTFPDIPFLEVAAFPAKEADMPPGTVIFGLSGGHRYQSWWEKAEWDLERRLDRLTEWD